MNLRGFLSRHYRRIKEAVRFYRHETVLPAHVPRGHFYSPLPDPEAVGSTNAPLSGSLLGINLNESTQHQVLLQIRELSQGFEWSEQRQTSLRFHLNQGYLTFSDSLVLFVMLRLYQPRRVIEIGSGFSSALMLDVNDRYLKGETQFTFVDPFPERLKAILREADSSKVHIVSLPVQDVPLAIFEELRSNDILFIDSSHISKVGSDVNHLYFDVLPKIAKGVLIHVHDIHWPFEYPTASIRKGLAWNEAYLLRAFLLFNQDFEVVFWVR